MKAEEFKRIREELKLTQLELAEFLGVQRKTVGCYERGERTIFKPIEKLMININKIMKCS